MRSRRSVLGLTSLAVSGPLLTGGCLGFEWGCRWRMTVYATPRDEIDPSVETPSGPERDLVATALADGHAEATTYRARPFEDGDFVEYDGTYYEARVSLVEETRQPALRLNVRARTDESLDDADVISFDSLPEADRAALDMLLYGEEYGLQSEPSDSFRAGDVPVPYPDGTDDSRFADAGPLWVRVGDREFRVAVEREGTITRRTGRFEFEEIGTTLAAVRDRMIDDPIDAATLPAAERDIVAEAVDGEYQTCEEEPPELESLTDRIEAANPADAWRAYVDYEGTIYEVRVDG